MRKLDLSSIRARQTEIHNLCTALNSKDTLSESDQFRFDTLMAEAETLAKKAENLRKLGGLSDPADAGAVANSAWNGPHISIGSQPAVYRDLGEQLVDVVALTLGNDMKAKSAAAERYQKVMNAASGASTGVDSDGGYLVETDKSRDILTTAIETGVLASRCTVQPISANADSFSYLAADDRDRSTGKMNGIQVYRKAEADTMSSSGKAKLKERELRVEDMYGLIYVTNRMLRDAAAMGSYVKRNLRAQLAFKLDKEIWQGSGAGECLGIVNSALPVSVAKETSQAAGTIVAENVVKMLGRFRGDLTRAAWFVNQDALPQFPLLKVADQPIYALDFKKFPLGGLFGLPIVPIEFCSSIGAKWDILLGDFSQYLLVEKGGIEEAESIHVRFLHDETAFRFIVRNNGQPMHDAPITPLNGSNTLSPFVTLDERAG